MRWRSRFRRRVRDILGIEQVIDDLTALRDVAGRLLTSSLVKARTDKDIRSYEAKIYSQFGEDGIVQFLLAEIDKPIPKRFVEIGVDDYRECNTRNLLVNYGWTGLVLEAQKDNVEAIQRSPIGWRYPLTVENSFVTAENAKATMAKHGYQTDLGLLSIDIDGMDFWVLQAADVRAAIVIAEYNALWGSARNVTVPYNASFDRFRSHWSGLYFGASIRSLVKLMEERDYRFVGSNSQGSNAFFVLGNLSDLPRLHPDDAQIRPTFNQARDARGFLNPSATANALQEISELPLLDLDTGRHVRVRDVLT